MSQYLTRYCSTAWDHLEHCPEHQFLEDSPKLTQVSSSSSFPVYLHGQRNNHKAQASAGIPRNVGPVSGLPQSPCQCQLEATLTAWGTALLSPTLLMLTQNKNHSAQELFAQVFLLLGEGWTLLGFTLC